MMNNAENDDYWNESRISTFNFERDDGNIDETWLGEDVCDVAKRSGNIAEVLVNSSCNSNVEIEIVRNYLSERQINCILLDGMDDSEPMEARTNATNLDSEIKLLRRRKKERWIAPSINDTIERIFFGKPFSLELYRSLMDKKKLLQLAVESADGDAILAAVLHLAKTLKKSLFRQILMVHPTAVSHYICYLYIRRQMSELSDTLEALGKSKEAMMKQLMIASQNPNRIQQRLSSISKNYAMEAWDCQIMDNFLTLIEWQMKASKQVQHSSTPIIGESAIEFIKYCCLHEVSLNLPNTTSKSESQPELLAKGLAISDKQLLMVLVRAYAETKKWDAIRNLLVVKSWVGGMKLNTTLPANKILEDLRKFNAPTGLLDDILMCIADYDKRIEIARKLDRPMIAIEAYQKKKDKAGLLQYASSLESQSAERLYAQEILNKMTGI